jgi:hypothetical protein
VTTALHDLDSYSEFAADIILGRLPEWDRYATTSREFTAEFAIPCPSRAVERGLWISTANNELTVGFHTDHCHFTDYDEPCNRAVVHRGLDFAVAILKDRCGILSWYQGDRLVHTTQIELPHKGPLPRLLSNCTTGTLRCWSGKFDKDEGGGQP